MHDLLHLRITDALSHNILLFPAIIVVFQHILVKTGILRGRSLLGYRHAPIVVMIIVVLFMVLRNLKFYPFEYLAP
ncbi:hypothetical protein [Flagellimonas onchidii]|uniref:hypothetical protein n=1 Tax=Flagellimonas onchidii TaxID=2562684 RepID=UPI003AAB4DBE